MLRVQQSFQDQESLGKPLQVGVYFTMEYLNLEMDRFFGSVDLRPLFLPPHRCYTINLTMYYKASNESYRYHLSTGTLWSEIDQVV